MKISKSILRTKTRVFYINRIREAVIITVYILSSLLFNVYLLCYNLILSLYNINIKYARLIYYIRSAAALLSFAAPRAPPSPPPPHPHPLAALSPPPPHSLPLPLSVPGPGRAAGAAPGPGAGSPSSGFSPPARGDTRRWVADEKYAERIAILTMGKIRRGRQGD
jgi:hypothetical protein